IERTPPEADLDPTAQLGASDPDALRYVFIGAASELPNRVSIVSQDPAGGKLDVLDSVSLRETTCPPGIAPTGAKDTACRAAPFIGAVADDVDRSHPLVKERSVRATVGGTLTIFDGSHKLRSIRVGGPRSTPVGPISRLRGHLHIFMVRNRPKGAPPFG